MQQEKRGQIGGLNYTSEDNILIISILFVLLGKLFEN